MPNPKNDRPKVLIIDDMIINQMLLSSQLAALDVDSDVTSNGKDGLLLYAKNEYDLILVDQHMPDMDGYETFDELKKIFEKEGKTVPVVCETADDSEEGRKQLMDAGFSDVLVKPLDFSELHDMMEREIGAAYSGEPIPDTEAEQKVDDSLKELPKWLFDVKGLEVRYGLERCGGAAQDYLDALAIFAASIKDKAADIKKYLKEKNERMYVLRMHSLKSVARLVGAVTLAEQAAALEFAGKAGNFSALENGTNTLIDHYLEIEEQLSANLSADGDRKIQKPPISEATLADAYSALADFTVCYDIDNVDMVLSSLGEYALSGDDAVRLERLKIARRKMDWESLRTVLSEVTEIRDPEPSEINL